MTHDDRVLASAYRCEHLHHGYIKGIVALPRGAEGVEVTAYHTIKPALLVPVDSAVSSQQSLAEVTTDERSEV